MKKMRYFLLFGLLALQLISPISGSASTPEMKTRKVARVNSQDYYFAKKLDELPIKLHPGSSFKKNSKSTPQTLARCKSTVYQTLQALPKEHTSYLTELTLYFSQDGRRGFGANNTVILRCLNVGDSELAGVLIHEIGHIVDTGLFQGSVENFVSEFDDFGVPVFEDDPSVPFYRISFQNSKETRENATPLDFVSGYAMQDPFEDFAETYAYYILHGSEFRQLTQSNRALNEKYRYMRDVVFHGREFGKNSSVGNSFFDFYRNYDVTILPYDLPRFFRGEF